MHAIAMFDADGGVHRAMVETVERKGIWALHAGANVLEPTPAGVRTFARVEYYTLDHLPTGLGIAAAPTFDAARRLLARVAEGAPLAFRDLAFGQPPADGTPEFVSVYALVQRGLAGV